MKKKNLLGLMSFLFISSVCADSKEPEVSPDLQADAEQMLDLIEHYYAYPERIPEGWNARFTPIREEIKEIGTRLELLDFAETTLHRLCDHHAITGPSSPNSSALVPSYSDLWLDVANDTFRITQVRRDSPASHADVRPGDLLVAIDDVPINELISEFWRGGVPAFPECTAYAARVLAAGPRQGTRNLTIDRDGILKQFRLESLYTAPRAERTEPISVQEVAPGVLHLRFNDSLGSDMTISAMDDIMKNSDAEARFIIDLRNTPSGGNSSIARAILGYFTDTIQPYQRHTLPVEMRENGVVRSWIEEVSPRHAPNTDYAAVLLVGRWTGSMGEGIAIGFDALGYEVVGSPMAGLLGAIYDLTLDHTGWNFKLPVERLAHVSGEPREHFMPSISVDAGYIGGKEIDPALEAALHVLQN